MKQAPHFTDEETEAFRSLMNFPRAYMEPDVAVGPYTIKESNY